jgi:imidazolonepropionase
MSLVIAQAVTALGLSVDEALRAATSRATDALRRSELGRAEVGAAADLVWWDADHEGAFAWAWGLPARAVWLAGRRVI